MRTIKLDQTENMNQPVIPPELYRGDLPSLSSRFPRIFDPASTAASATIGIGALTHDTSAALVRDIDGAVVFATAEERLSNVKHDSRFPSGALLRCCQTAEENGYRISGVAVNFRPIEFITLALRNQLAGSFQEETSEMLTRVAEQLFNAASEPFYRDTPSQTRARLVSLLAASSLAGRLSRNQQAEYELRLSWYFNAAFKYRRIGELVASLFPTTPLSFVNHHDSHAASAYFGMGEQEAAILVVDGHGESDTTSLFGAKGAEIHELARTAWPHSLGSLYLSATRYLGFDYGDEYKVMGMAAYGKPRFLDSLRAMAEVTDHGRLRLKEGKLLRLGNVRNSGSLVKFPKINALLKFIIIKSKIKTQKSKFMYLSLAN